MPSSTVAHYLLLLLDHLGYCYLWKLQRCVILYSHIRSHTRYFKCQNQISFPVKYKPQVELFIALSGLHCYWTWVVNGGIRSDWALLPYIVIIPFVKLFSERLRVTCPQVDTFYEWRWANITHFPPWWPLLFKWKQPWGYLTMEISHPLAVNLFHWRLHPVKGYHLCHGWPSCFLKTNHKKIVKACDFHTCCARLA